MKLVKKIVPVMLSLALCAGMVAPALAHTVTVDGVDGSHNVGTVNEGVEIIAGSDSKSGTIELNTDGGATGSKNSDDTYTFKENVVIGGDVNVTLDLNGNTLVHGSDANPKDAGNPVKATVTVEKGSKLTVEDSSAEEDSDTEGATGTGTIDAVTDDISAILNEGDVTLNGGTFTRSEEDGKANNVGGNSYYTIVNHGDMEINDGVTVENDGKYSSTIDNGWSGAVSTANRPPDDDAVATLTINGGELTGGSATVKNDNQGKLEINGGTITGGLVAVQNYGEAVINDGNFSQANPESNRNGVIWNGDATASKQPAYSYSAPGNLTITGGNFGESNWYQHAGGTAEISVDSMTVGSSTGLGLLLKIDAENWTVDNDVVTVDESGNVTAVSAGTATVTATVNGNEVKFTIIVTPAPGGNPGDVIIDDADIPLGEGPEEIEIDEEDIPLASGPVTRAEFVNCLWTREGKPEAEATAFDDVAEDHEYAAAIDWARSIGIIEGNGDNTFSPDDLVAVAAVRTILTRYAAWAGIEMPELASLTGADSAPVLNCDEVIAEFFGEAPSAEEGAA